MRPDHVRVTKSVVIEPLEDCPVAEATNEYLSYTYKIPGLGYLFRYSYGDNAKWFEHELMFASDNGERKHSICLGNLIEKTPDDILPRIMPTYLKMAEIVLKNKKKN
jgi:hypothetical protein